MKRTFSKEELEFVYEGESDEEFGFIVKEVTPWTSGGKYQDSDVIFFANDDKTHYRLCRSRTGSPYTEYHYCREDRREFTCDEVAQVIVQKTEWKVVQDGN